MLIGLAFGTGMALIVTYSGRWHSLTFHARVAAAMAGTGDRRPDRSLRQRVVQRQLGGGRTAAIEAKQTRAGREPDAAAHVLHRTATALVGMAVATALALLLGLTGSVRHPVAAVVFIPLAGVMAAVVHESRLDAAGRARALRAGTEMPSIAETLALAVAAGASVVTAIDIVGRRSTGVLAQELRRATAGVAAGSTLDEALAGLQLRLPFPPVVRFVDALRIALERGTPVVDVLRAQAGDARHESRRTLLEAAGQREIAMLVPVVFCILPAVVVIAFYPGMRQLALVAG